MPHTPRGPAATTTPTHTPPLALSNVLLRNLHSHLHRSPLSGNQEVSAYGENGVGDSGDEWILETKTSGDEWVRRDKVRFRHKDTGTHLWSCSLPALRVCNVLPCRRRSRWDATWVNVRLISPPL